MPRVHELVRQRRKTKPFFAQQLKQLRGHQYGERCLVQHHHVANLVPKRDVLLLPPQTLAEAKK